MDAIPEELKFTAPFLQRAQELQQRDPVVAYYCNFYAAKSALAKGINKSNKEATAFLMQLLDKLEADKKEMAGNEAITNDTVGYAHVENFALKVFLNADNEDRAGSASKATVRKFLAASLFLELLAVFGDLDAQVVEKIRYAKWKAVDITKALKEGRKPTPGPPGGEAEEPPSTMPSTSGAAPLPPPRMESSVSPSVPSSVPTSVPPTTQIPPPVRQIPPPVSATPAAAKAPTPVAGSTPGMFLDPKVSNEVQKFCRYTISAIQYDDVKTAVQNLEAALALLRPYQNKP